MTVPRMWLSPLFAASVILLHAGRHRCVRATPANKRVGVNSFTKKLTLAQCHSVKPKYAVVPAKAGTQYAQDFYNTLDWMARYGQLLPASAGMTNIYLAIQ